MDTLRGGSDTSVRKYDFDVPESQIDDLRQRIASTRLPEREAVHAADQSDSWKQGVPLSQLVEILEYWRTEYSWRRLEDKLRSIGQYETTMDGLRIRFLHSRSDRPDATPLVLTHGWPGSVLEYVDIVDELTNPSTPDAPAFHVVVPSLPGFGFSGKPTEPGWGAEKIASAWVALMEALGYTRFVAQGGDWGGIITTILGGRYSSNVIGIHTTTAQAPPGLSINGLSPAEVRWVEESERFWSERGAYAKQQATRPQTIGYALVDSPAALLAWIVDKFAEWTDSTELMFGGISRDQILDNVSLYWFTKSGASAARIYYESHNSLDPNLRVEVPAAITTYPFDIEKYPRDWVEKRYSNIVAWSTPQSGGHFPSIECPEYFVSDIRAGLASVLKYSGPGFIA